MCLVESGRKRSVKRSWFVPVAGWLCQGLGCLSEACCQHSSKGPQFCGAPFVSYMEVRYVLSCCVWWAQSERLLAVGRGSDSVSAPLLSVPGMVACFPARRLRCEVAACWWLKPRQGKVRAVNLLGASEKLYCLLFFVAIIIMRCLSGRWLVFFGV